jgi:formate hydrogenlyase subunit 4
MIEAASQLKFVLYASLIASLFLPFGIVRVEAGPVAWLGGGAIYLGKIAGAAILLGIWEVSIAKMRVFRVSEFLGGAFVFAFLAILLTFVTREVLK